MHQYIHIDSVGNIEKCLKTYQEVAKVLFPLYNIRKITSYGNYIYTEPIEINITILETDFQKFTRFELPFFVSRIHLKPDLDLNLEEIMQKIGFQRLTQLGNNPTTR